MPDADRLARVLPAVESEAHPRHRSRARLRVAGSGHGRLPGRQRVPVQVHRSVTGHQRHGHCLWPGSGDDGACDRTDRHRKPDLGARRYLDRLASGLGRTLAAYRAVHGGVPGQRPVSVCRDRDCRPAPEPGYLAVATDGARHPVVHPVQRDRRSQRLAD